MGEGSEREQWHLLRSLPDFSHFPCYPQPKRALPVLIPGWVVCVHSRTLWVSCEAGSFSRCRINPQRCYQSVVWGFISPHWNPGLCGLFHSLIVPLGLSVCECGTACSTSRGLVRSASCRLAASPLHPSRCACLPFLPIWMNVSSLTPWLSDFHTVQFSVSSGCFLFVICCCHSFGCARRHSVSTYASILPGSLNLYF